MDKSQFSFIDKAIKTLQFTTDTSKESMQLELDAIKRNLNRIFYNIECTDIFINDGNFKTKFFGMRVFYEKEETSAFVKHLITNFDNKSVKPYIPKKYIIEIDGRLLFDRSIKAGSDEIIAVMLHEIGHICNTDMIYKEARLSIANSLTRLGLEITSVTKFFSIGHPFLCLVELATINIVSNICKYLICNKSETEADKFVISCDYGDSLLSLFNKLHSAIGLSIRQTFKDTEKDNDIIMSWSIDDMVNFDIRSKHISDILNIEFKNATSEYLKLFLKQSTTNLNKFIKDSLRIIKLRESLDNYTDKRNTKILSETFINFKKFPEKFKREDIDEVRLEMQRVENVDDKLYVLEMISSRKDKVDIAMHYLLQYPDNPKKYNLPDIETLQSYYDQLTHLESALIQMKMNTRKYGVFVKYPDGYEG